MSNYTQVHPCPVCKGIKKSDKQRMSDKQKRVEEELCNKIKLCCFISILMLLGSYIIIFFALVITLEFDLDDDIDTSSGSY